MSLKNSPSTPHRPLYARSLSARRASPASGYLTSNHGSPSASVEDSISSPTVPLTPLDVYNARTTPKVWSESKLESILEGSANGFGIERSRLDKSKILSSSRFRSKPFSLADVAITGNTGKGVNSFTSDDPFTTTNTKMEDTTRNVLNGSLEQFLTDSSAPAALSTTNQKTSDAEIQSTSEPIVTIGDVVVTDDNAQALLHPGSCIFVANLPRDLSDSELYDQVKLTFMKYGYCFVKIRRNYSSNTPHAFVQYMTSEQAAKALALGRGDKVGGRSCRTEMAIAPRILFVSRKDNAPFEESMVHELLGKIGEIAEVSKPTLNEQVFYRLASGYFVKMSLYQAALSALSIYRYNPVWSVLPHHSVVPARKDPGSSGMSRIAQFDNKPSMHPSNFPTINTAYECLWVNNIPLGSSFNSFIHLLLTVGPIDRIETRISINPAPVQCCAWVQFAQPGLVATAVSALNGFQFLHCTLHAQMVMRAPNMPCGYESMGNTTFATSPTS